MQKPVCALKDIFKRMQGEEKAWPSGVSFCLRKADVKDNSVVMYVFTMYGFEMNFKERWKGNMSGMDENAHFESGVVEILPKQIWKDRYSLMLLRSRWKIREETSEA